MKDSLINIMNHLDRIFEEVDWNDPKQVGQTLKEMVVEFVDQHKQLEDTFYLKKTALWLIDICTSRARQGHTLTSFPRPVAKILDDAYFAISDNRIDGKYSVESNDRELQQALDQPDFKSLLKAVDEKTDTQGEKPDLTIA